MGSRGRRSTEGLTVVKGVANRPDPPRDLDAAEAGNLAGYVALLHLCGAEALGDEPLPMVEVDPWTGMAFGRVTLHSVLKRDGEAAVADWVSARDLRRRLEQLSAAQRKRLPGPTV
jgi:hypothetical protein